MFEKTLNDFLSKINSTKVLVIAGSIREFDSFIDLVLYRNSQDGLYDGYEFTYYSSERTVRGNRFDHCFYYGTGIDRNDIDIDYIRMSIKS